MILFVMKRRLRLVGPSLRWLWQRVRGLWLLWLIAGAVVVVGAILWAAVVEPSWLLPDTRGLSPADRVKAQTDLRTTLVTTLGGLVVIAGAVVGALNFHETQRQNRAVLELQRRGQVTERFTRAIDQLDQQRGDDKLDVRIGAVYALEQIARDSAERHWPIMEVLTAYLPQHAPASAAPADARETLAAPTVSPGAPKEGIPLLGSPGGGESRRGGPARGGPRGHAPGEGGTPQAHLDKADLRMANLEGADLTWEQLQGAASLDGARPPAELAARLAEARSAHSPSRAA